MAHEMTGTSKIMPRGRRLASRFARDARGLAAVEFAFILPLMLTLVNVEQVAPATK